MYEDIVQLDHTLYEALPHGRKDFPIQFYIDELYKFENKSFPLHWHYELEFFIAKGGAINVQIGNHFIVLNPGDGIFINGNTLHSFEQINDNDKCQCPNIVFSAELIAHHTSVIYQKYVRKIMTNPDLPYFVLHPHVPWHNDILSKLSNAFALLHQYGLQSPYGSFPDIHLEHEPLQQQACFEMEVQRYLNQIWQAMFNHLEQIPSIPQTQRDVQYQVRLQQMLTYIQQNYMNALTLQNISDSANISRSEASRCFHSYLNSSPIEYLLQYRIEAAKRLLCHTTRSIQEICIECGFNSASYFIKIFKKKVGTTPREYRKKV